MPKGSNPFAELYVSETIPPRDFTELFSPFLVPQAIELFQPGNVVLLGVQGSGKSMLLSLFRPSIRVAYAVSETPFPIPHEQSAFLSAGVNLRRSAAAAFGQRRIENTPAADAEQTPLYFGDFLNYQVAAELCAAVDLFSAQGKPIATALGLRATASRLNEFASTLAQDDCWFGALRHVRTYADLRDALRKRIQDYFLFLNFNSDALPDVIRQTKTKAGHPISRTAWGLRSSGIVPSTTPIFVVVDEYDELSGLAAGKGTPAHQFTRVVNSAIATRDPNFSYRIGSRPYGWGRDLSTFATGSRLEQQRDYSVVDIDRLLQRFESRASYIFPNFIDDVLRRRLTYANYRVPHETKDRLARLIFQKSPPAPTLAEIYSGGNAVPATLRSLQSDAWTEEWLAFLPKLARRDPLSAKLAEAWARQGGGKRMQQAIPKRDKATRKFPWERVYWRKERVQQALLQIAASNAQRLIWGGEEQVEALSGGNIFTFLSLCRRIWETFLRSNTGEADASIGQDGLHTLPRIPLAIQSVGLTIASAEWFAKIIELPGGNQRQRFIEVLARFSLQQLHDPKMSYPGHNGFSTNDKEVERDGDVFRFLSDAVDYGDLFARQHTTKNSSREKRTKWYIRPVFSPHLRLPVTHVKEPYYATVAEVRAWLDSAATLTTQGTRAPARAGKKRSAQLEFPA